MRLGMEVGLGQATFCYQLLSPILSVEVRISKVIASFVALEQQITLVKTRSESV